MNREDIISLIEGELHDQYATMVNFYGTSQIPFDKNDPMYLKGRLMGMEELLNKIRASECKGNRHAS